MAVGYPPGGRSHSECPPPAHHPARSNPASPSPFCTERSWFSGAQTGNVLITNWVESKPWLSSTHNIKSKLANLFRNPWTERRLKTIWRIVVLIVFMVWIGEIKSNQSKFIRIKNNNHSIFKPYNFKPVSVQKSASNVIFWDEEGYFFFLLLLLFLPLQTTLKQWSTLETPWILACSNLRKNQVWCEISHPRMWRDILPLRSTKAHSKLIIIFKKNHIACELFQQFTCEFR